MTPIVDAVKKKYSSKVEIKKIDTDDPKDQEVASKYNIRVIPTLVFIDKTGNEVEKHPGALDQSQFEGKINSLLLK
ncbi:MAG: thioredoxin fold domain-containing protein [Actinomycetia bacterium]|nr:thioredoxin fold domain-containing protein [Actinomycetes bacterium]